MTRRIMGAVVAFLLVATLLMPLGSVGAQEEDVDIGTVPVATEDVVPETDPPPVAEEPPIEEPAIDQPVVQEPVVEAPVTDEPVVDEPAVEEPTAEDPTAGEQTPAETTDDAVDAQDEDDWENGDWEEEFPFPDVSNVSIDCTGLVTFDMSAGSDSWLYVEIYTGTPPYGTQIGTYDAHYLGGDSQYVNQVSLPADLDNVWVEVWSDAPNEYLGGSDVVSCGEPTDPEDPIDPEDPTDPEEPNTPEGSATVISGVSITCAGLVTFTIDDAQMETLRITVFDPEAPIPFHDLALDSFEVTETGTFSLQYEIDARDSVAVSVRSEASDSYQLARINNCLTEEDEINEGWFSGVSVTCDGTVSATANDYLDGDYRIDLFAFDGTSWQAIGSHYLNAGILSPGDYSHSFELPENTWDQLRAELNETFPSRPYGFATVSGCLDDEPEPEPEVDASVDNLTVTCDGLIAFDLTANGPVTLEVSFFIPAAAPGYRDSTLITASTGPQQVQLTPRSNGAFEWYASVVLGNDELASASVRGCPWRPPNTLPGPDVVVEVGGGAVTFDEVLEVGDTTVTELDPSEAPPLPAGYDPDLVILLDISTTAQFDGAVQICLPMSAEQRADAANVHLLHFENGAWVDITISSSALNGMVCGLTSNFSPFAIVKLMGEDPDGPDGPSEPGGPHPNPNPSGPDNPGHHGPRPGWNHPRPHIYGAASTGSGGTTPTSLPNTGSGMQPETLGTQNWQLLLSGLALMAACGLRHASARRRGMRAR